MSNTYKPEENTVDLSDLVADVDTIDLSGLTDTITVSTTATTPSYIIGTSAGFNGTYNYTTGTSATSYTYNNTGYNISPNVIVSNDPPTLDVNGTLVVNGRDIEKRLDVIEKVLNIPERDVKLEEKYPKLKKMYDEYIKELSKARMWESLKGESE